MRSEWESMWIFCIHLGLVPKFPICELTQLSKLTTKWQGDKIGCCMCSLSCQLLAATSYWHHTLWPFTENMDHCCMWQVMLMNGWWVYWSGMQW